MIRDDYGAKTYRIDIEIVEIRGTGACNFGHKIGDKLNFPRDWGKICPWLFHSVFPLINVLRFGGKLPWEPNSDVAWVCCPDPHNSVVVKIHRSELEPYYE